MGAPEAPALASVSAAPCSGAASDKISVDKIFPLSKQIPLFFFFIKSLEATTLMILVNFLLIFTNSETSCFLALKRIFWRSQLLLGIWPLGYFTSFKGVLLNSKALA